MVWRVRLIGFSFLSWLWFFRSNGMSCCKFYLQIEVFSFEGNFSENTLYQFMLEIVGFSLNFDYWMEGNVCGVDRMWLYGCIFKGYCFLWKGFEARLSSIFWDLATQSFLPFAAKSPSSSYCFSLFVSWTCCGVVSFTSFEVLFQQRGACFNP